MLLKECHDGPLMGHGGAKCTITFFKKYYYWLNLKDDVEEYVKICLTYQQNRTFNKKQPPHILGCGTFLGGNEMCHLVNRFTTTMIASNPLNAGKLTMKSMDTLSRDPLGIGNMFKHHGLPKDIVLD